MNWQKIKKAFFVKRISSEEKERQDILQALTSTDLNEKRRFLNSHPTGEADLCVLGTKRRLRILKP